MLKSVASWDTHSSRPSDDTTRGSLVLRKDDRGDRCRFMNRLEAYDNAREAEG